MLLFANSCRIRSSLGSKKHQNGLSGAPPGSKELTLKQKIEKVSKMKEARKENGGAAGHYLTVKDKLLKGSGTASQRKIARNLININLGQNPSSGVNNYSSAGPGVGDNRGY